MDGSRRETDVDPDERAAEATWIAQWLASEGRDLGADDVDAILRAHRTYLTLPPPDRFEPLDPGSMPAAPVQPAAPSSGDADPDRETDDVGHDGRGSPDHDLAST